MVGYRGWFGHQQLDLFHFQITDDTKDLRKIIIISNNEKSESQTECAFTFMSAQTG